MVISLLMQSKLLIFSVLAGVLTGFLFDTYRIFRGFENIPQLLIIVEDILFWTLAAIVVFIFLLFTNYAFVGLYVYFLIALGIYIYMKLISRHFTSLQYIIIINFSRMIRIIINLVFYPFRLLIYSLSEKNKRNFKRNDLNNH
jgi:spore cortex biosynthesis protein YabQ